MGLSVMPRGSGESKPGPIRKVKDIRSPDPTLPVLFCLLCPKGLASLLSLAFGALRTL